MRVGRDNLVMIVWSLVIVMHGTCVQFTRETCMSSRVNSNSNSSKYELFFNAGYSNRK